MPKIYPLHLRPLVGYLMWYIGRKERDSNHYYTVDEAVAKAKAEPKFAGIPDDEFQRALDRALSNRAALHRLQEYSSKLSVADDGSVKWE